MTPILFEYNETSFITNGIGRLSDATSCIVTEERNGAYELTLEYPEGGQHANDIEIERIIWAKPAALMDPQPFRIYKITKLLNQLFKVYAHHISYDLNYITVNPCGPYASNLLALQGMVANTNGIGNFVLGTVGSGPTANFEVTEPASFRNWMGGREGSILDVYGGELEWDKFTINLLAARGIDRGLVLRYGKNITDISKEQGIDHTISGVCPFMRAGDGSTITLPQHVVWRSTITQPARAISMDFSQYVDEQAIREAHPDETDVQINARLVTALQAAAEAYVANELPASPTDNIEVSFVNLGDTEEYKDMAALFTQAALCDTVTIIYPRLGIQTTAKIIKTEYNVLLERFEKLTIGKARATLGDKLTQISGGATTYINNTNAQQNASIYKEAAEAEADAIATAQQNTESAIATNTDLITGVDGGYIRVNRDNTGKPFEILIMDDPDISRAVKVWRWNINGLGYSSSGYNGPYTSALSMAGIFNTDFIAANTLSGTKIQAGTLDAGKITTGTLDAALIKTGLLADYADRNFINMLTGAFSFCNGNMLYNLNDGDYIQLSNNLSLRLNGIPLAGQKVDNVGVIADSEYVDNINVKMLEKPYDCIISAVAIIKKDFTYSGSPVDLIRGVPLLGFSVGVTKYISFLAPRRYTGTGGAIQYRSNHAILWMHVQRATVLKADWEQWAAETKYYNIVSESSTAYTVDYGVIQALSDIKNGDVIEINVAYITATS